MATTPIAGSGDPSVLRQIELQNAALTTRPQLTSAPSVTGTSGAPTSTASTTAIALAPVVNGGETLYPLSTATTSSNAITITSSISNDTGDVTTIYSAGGRITSTAINQTINQFTAVDSGVSQVIAGNGVTITSTGENGKGVVTISSSTTFGNIVSVNLTGSNANVLYGNGVFAPVAGGNGTYGDSNVVSLLSAFGSNTITTTGNVSVGNIVGNSTINIDNRDSGNAADIQLFAADDIVLQARDRTLGSTSEGGDINLFAGDSAEDGDSSGGDVVIEAGAGGAANVDFGGSGGFITIQSGRGGAAIGNSGYSAENGGDLTLSAGDAGDNNGNIDLGSAGGAVFIESGFSTGNTDYGGEIVLTTGTGGQNAASGNVRIVIPGYGLTTGGTWKFDGTGNLTLPGNTFAVNYANGTAVSIGGGGANTGNVTFDDNIVIGTGDEFGSAGLFLAPGNGSIANSAVQYLRVRGGDAPTHIHLDTGNNEYYDQYFGADSRYVKLEANGNVVINADDYNGNSATWTLTTDGNLILAGGNSVIQSIANSSLDPVNPNISTMVLTPDPGYSSQSLVLDPTAPGHIHLRAPGANIDEPSANIFLGGEESSFEVGYHNGAAPNLFIHSGGNTWTFDNAGNLAFPRDAAGNSDPYLNIFGGSTPTIQSTDVSLAGPANLAIQADYLNLSGFSGDKIVFYADTGEIATDANMTLTTNLANTGNTSSWTFSDDGLLTLPGGNVTIGNVLGGEAILASNTPFGVVSQGNGSTVLQWIDDVSNASALSAIYINSPSGNTGDVAVLTGEPGANANIWTFGADGILTVPGDLVAVNASPAPVISGFSSVSALQFTNGNSNVTINANSNTWNFDSTGNLTIPGTSGGFIKTASNASIGIVAMDNGTNNPAQLLSMNVGNGNATSIVSAYATNATIQTNAAGAINTWSFDNAGNLTLPANTFAINYANGTQVSLGGGNISNISNGNSNVSIATANGNVTISAVGNTTMTVTGTGANVTGTLTSTGKIGYASGSTVTQLTSRGTGVTINALAGTIVTTSAAMVATEIDTFSVVNSSVDPNNDIVLAQIVSPNQGTYDCIANPAVIGGFNDGFYINIVNISGFTTADETITIRFMVFKAPNA